MKPALLALCLSALCFTGCPGPIAPVDGGPAVTPTSWVSTARTVLLTLQWAIPAAKVVTNATLQDPGRTQVARALDAVTDSARDLGAALDTYESRGGDQCVAHAAVGASHRALMVLATVLAANGIAIGNTIGGIIDALGSVIDGLVPACQRDAGWASVGEQANRELQRLGSAQTLLMILNDLRPLDGGVR